MVQVGIIIVHYRTAELACACLESLAADPWVAGNCRVMVVENGSGDGSAERLRTVLAPWPWCRLLESPANRGFAAGNNLGLRALMEASEKPAYFLLLNPDTLVESGAIATLTAFLESHPSVGIAGSRLQDAAGSLQVSAFRFPTIWGEVETAMRLGVVSKLLARHVVAPPPSGSAHVADWVAGASMMIRRQVVEQVGLLDEAYFMYFEEVDFCRRARQQGWSCWHVPASRIVHLVGQASGINSADTHPRRRPCYWFESRRRYFQKNHGRFYAVLADGAWLAANVTTKLRRFLQRQPEGAPPCFWRDMFRHSSLFHGIGS